MEFLLVYVSIIIAMLIVTIKDFENVAVTPKEIYESNDLNMFGCVVIFVVMFLVNPLFFIAHFYTGYFILTWLMTNKHVYENKGNRR